MCKSAPRNARVGCRPEQRSSKMGEKGSNSFWMTLNACEKVAACVVQFELRERTVWVRQVKPE